MQLEIVNVTVAGGFPASDVPEAGLSVLVTTNNDPDLATATAESIARRAFALRDGFLGGVSSFEEAALAIAEHHAKGSGKPLILVDIGDNPWTGGPGDSAELLRFLLEVKAEKAALAIICDPESVTVCTVAGVGQAVTVSLGGNTDELHGQPLEVVGVVVSVSDGKYRNAGPMMAGVEVDLGPTVVLQVGQVQVIVTSRAESPIDLNVFRINGIEPTDLQIIGLKGKGHFRAAYEPIADRVILVEGPGITGADLSRLPFQHIRRPIWPLDPDVTW